MQDQQFYLKPNVRIEGLVNNFCAWLHVFAPVPAAMNLAKLHMPMLDSFVEEPQVHADAVVNPKMKGSFFINIDTERVDEVRDLRDRIRDGNQAGLELADAVARAESLLQAQATGYDLSPLYQQLPEELQGLVELAYDM